MQRCSETPTAGPMYRPTRTLYSYHQNQLISNKTIDARQVKSIGLDHIFGSVK